MAVIREALCTFASVVVGNLVKQKSSSIYFQELTSAVRQRAIYFWHVFTLCFALWAVNLHRGVWRIKASKSSPGSCISSVLQRTEGIQGSVFAPLPWDSEQHPGYCSGGSASKENKCIKMQRQNK